MIFFIKLQNYCFTVYIGMFFIYVSEKKHTIGSISLVNMKEKDVDLSKSTVIIHSAWKNYMKVCDKWYTVNRLTLLLYILYFLRDMINVCLLIMSLLNACMIISIKNQLQILFYKMEIKSMCRSVFALISNLLPSNVVRSLQNLISVIDWKWN